jgi:hypothetical protein
MELSVYERSQILSDCSQFLPLKTRWRPHRIWEHGALEHITCLTCELSDIALLPLHVEARHNHTIPLSNSQKHNFGCFSQSLQAGVCGCRCPVGDALHVPSRLHHCLSRHDDLFSGAIWRLEQCPWWELVSGICPPRTSIERKFGACKIACSQIYRKQLTFRRRNPTDIVGYFGEGWCQKKSYVRGNPIKPIRSQKMEKTRKKWEGYVAVLKNWKRLRSVDGIRRVFEKVIVDI